MRSIIRAFQHHPSTVGESYIGHLRTAFRISGVMVFAGAACFIHGVFPFLFKGTASQMMMRLQSRMEGRGSEADASGRLLDPARQRARHCDSLRNSLE